MAVKKHNIIGIALLAVLASTPVSNVFADSGNNLVQLDLKRASDNSVNVTLFTSNSYNDNVFVRKKSDNKYVILIPKVQSAGYSSSNLNGVRDLVSDVNVKTVNDTNGGYTKVTLITTKPLDIKTSARKSAPVTEEQKEYKTLIAQANAVKNNIGKQEPQQKQSVNKTEVTVNKAPAQQPAKTQKTEKITVNKTENIKPAVTKQASKTQTTKEVKAAVKKQSEAPKIKLTEVNPDNIERQTRREQLAELINEVKQEKSAEKPPESNIVQETSTVAGTTFSEPVRDIKELPALAAPNFIQKLKNTAKKTAKGVGYTILSLLGLIIISNILRAIFGSVKSGKKSFSEGFINRPPVVNSVKYNNIVNNDELSWQEKYQRYLDASAKPVPRANNKGTYTFIKTPAEPVSNPVEDKRRELEKMVSEVSENQISNINIEPEIIEIQNEEDAIQKTIKFKAFDNRKLNLDTTSRDKIKSRFKKYEKEIPLHEQKNIELGDSILHANPRRLKDANLSVSDVTGGRRMKFKPSEYIMSSADEFFSILDKEQSAKDEAKRILSPSSIQDIKIPASKTVNMSNPAGQTNPIAKLRNETKASYINGLIVKSGFNIDENKGFYIVNVDGKSALVGKVNDEVFVLKKFDNNVTNPIQVRHDNANVYMVKAGDFKSLVEVNNDKMGVLIEL